MSQLQNSQYQIYTMLVILSIVAIVLIVILIDMYKHDKIEKEIQVKLFSDNLKKHVEDRKREAIERTRNESKKSKEKANYESSC